ncbi:hypothetical protein E6C27_scaffold511G001200 [Cucumis melo var. makuwa]|uniref:Uncharacterized protein n=1 Tax=Cucumis melo var. makuwa TaxID=1194695 RepID=A0A5A7UAE6_CUCMM|nr:hypothetical protein E6C27_scaffold511G001200 [Cucumis melo var. makuwa]
MGSTPPKRPSKKVKERIRLMRNSQSRRTHRAYITKEDKEPSVSGEFPLTTILEETKAFEATKDWTMSPEQSQYIRCKIISHIEVGMRSGVFTSHDSARFGR